MKFKLKLLANYPILSLPGHSRVYEYTINRSTVWRNPLAPIQRSWYDAEIQLAWFQGWTGNPCDGEKATRTSTARRQKAWKLPIASNHHQMKSFTGSYNHATVKWRAYRLPRKYWIPSYALIDSTTQSFLIDMPPTADNMSDWPASGIWHGAYRKPLELGSAEAKLHVTVKNVKAMAGFDKPLSRSWIR